MIYRVLFSLLIFLVGVLGASLINYSLAQSQETARPVYLDQGWTSSDRKAWYTTSQGSRLLLASWMRALEVEGSGTKFLSPQNMTRLGYLPGAKPSDLPVGFAIDSSSEAQFDKPAVGMTCAACHTAELRLKGKAVRIDGAPTLANYEAFMAEFVASLKATHAKDDKFARFAAAVLGAQNTKGARATLKSELEGRIAWYEKLAKFNHSGTAYGQGRLDAQGHILNKIALVTGADQSILQPPDAPVSYPFIWNAHQHDRIQWNGMLTQMGLNSINVHGKTGDLGALVRNVGEVLGVFAEIDVEKGDWERGFKSSVRVDNLIRLEGLLTELQAPKWPTELLGPIKGNVKRGADLFNTRKLKNYASAGDTTATCSQCHQALQSDDTTSPVHAYMQPVMEAGTDMWAACNVVLHKAGAGNMEGRGETGLAGPVAGQPIQAADATVKMLRNAIIGSIVYKYDGIPDAVWRDWVLRSRPTAEESATGTVPAKGAPQEPPTDPRQLRALGCGMASMNPQVRYLIRYKARPLNGIWATAPYLHNGSVLTLYDMLLPAKQRDDRLALGTTKAGGAPRLRRDTFYVGSRDFDDVEVGLRSEPGEGRTEFRVRNADGTEIYGNSNAGHEWGAAELSDEDRWAIVAYLKTL
jgi:hypothetical protein